MITTQTIYETVINEGFIDSAKRFGRSVAPYALPIAALGAGLTLQGARLLGGDAVGNPGMLGSAVNKVMSAVGDTSGAVGKALTINSPILSNIQNNALGLATAAGLGMSLKSASNIGKQVATNYQAEKQKDSENTERSHQEPIGAEQQMMQKRYPFNYPIQNTMR